MIIPEPRVGLVVSYAYLWRDEARAGLEEGRKDRPCVIVVATEVREGQTFVTVAPITHSPPTASEAANAFELPAASKARLGLDAARSWAIASDLNSFIWPGVDLRPVRQGREEVAFGFLPGNLVKALRDQIIELARTGGLRTTRRTQ